MPHKLQQQRFGLHAAAAPAHGRVAPGRTGEGLGGSSGARRAMARRGDFLCAPAHCTGRGLHFLSFEQREEEPPAPGSSGGGSEQVLPFSVRWSGEWNTMHDIHALQQVSGPVTKLCWLIAGAAGRL